jgi:hypothetical protein
MCSRKIFALITLALASGFASPLQADPLQPYGNYIVNGLDIGATRTAFNAAYPSATMIPPEVPMAPEDNYQIIGTVITTVPALRLVSFHFVRDRLAGITFSGGVAPSYPERAALLKAFRTNFLQGFTHQSTDAYRAPSGGGVKTVKVETWILGALKKALFVERDDFAQVVIFDPAKIGKTVLLPWLNDPSVALIPES